MDRLYGTMLRRASGIAFALVAVVSSGARAQAGSEVLTNEAVVQMVTGKLGKDLILSKVQNTPNSFDLTSKAIITLNENKVPREVILAMMRTKPVKPTAGEVLTNEAVVRMLDAKVSKEIVIAKIQNTKSAFDVTASGLVGLNQSKVPQEIIKLMMAPTAPVKN